MQRLPLRHPQHSNLIFLGEKTILVKVDLAASDRKFKMSSLKI